MAGPHTLLVVEDDPDCRAAISDVLADEGYGLAFAADGDEALRALGDGPPPDAILLDLSMPRMTGWQFRDLQKRMPPLAGIPVLAVTGSAPLGIDAARVLRKPFDRAELLAALHDVLRGR
jgi:CheY-like chemotaxis protein